MGGKVKAIRLEEKLALISDHWNPRIVAELNENYVKLAKIRGEFVWHKHDHEDEMFLVIRGRLTILLRDGSMELASGDMCVIPHGVEHRPVAEDEAHILLVEPKSTRNTGQVEDERTRDRLDWI
jgi:mannose-6-phosphate isomerase-like protein (cupin superfamily)